MKFKDIKEGMYVKDHLGNEYHVVAVTTYSDTGYHVRLKMY